MGCHERPLGCRSVPVLTSNLAWRGSGCPQERRHANGMLIWSRVCSSVLVSALTTCQLWYEPGSRAFLQTEAIVLQVRTGCRLGLVCPLRRGAPLVHWNDWMLSSSSHPLQAKRAPTEFPRLYRRGTTVGRRRSINQGTVQNRVTGECCEWHELLPMLAWCLVRVTSIDLVPHSRSDLTQHRRRQGVPSRGLPWHKHIGARASWIVRQHQIVNIERDGGRDCTAAGERRRTSS